MSASYPCPCPRHVHVMSVSMSVPCPCPRHAHVMSVSMSVPCPCPHHVPVRIMSVSPPCPCPCPQRCPYSWPRSASRVKVIATPRWPAEPGYLMFSGGRHSRINACSYAIVASTESHSTQVSWQPEIQSLTSATWSSVKTVGRALVTERLRPNWSLATDARKVLRLRSKFLARCLESRSRSPLAPFARPA